MFDALNDFRNAIRAAGLEPPDEIAADGELHRFPTNGKDGDDAGWYVLHLNGVHAGSFGCWRSEIRETWRAYIGRKLSGDETKAYRAKAAAMRKAREEEERRGHRETAAKAARTWGAPKPATEAHGYLKRKGIQPHGTRVGADGWLLVPMCDADGKLWNLERIAPEKPTDGSTDKKGLCRGKRKGCSFTFGVIGEPVVVLCEGFATGASLDFHTRPLN